jgi:eukaryotic-like serine/threonine-protein kinase
MVPDDPPPTASIPEPTFDSASEPNSDVHTREPGAARSLAVGDVLRGRWKLVQFLGQGGTGAVFAARDLELGGEVALKVLTRVSGGALYRLKNEFRVLSDVAHPNLVRLLELDHDANHWFVVMELVRGTDFISYVRDQQRGYDLERLRVALRGLSRGVAAIHAADKLHRDLKPSNVLVRPGGQVVIVDFGLVSEQQRGEAGQAFEGLFVGTPAYAAPEQLAGLELSTASDWYAVGVMLYEALTGRSMRGSAPTNALEELTRRPPAPSSLVEVPPDLDRLCIALLERDPAARPSGAAILAALDVRVEPEAERVSAEPTHFVGREPELAQLAAALSESRAGRPRVVLVHGPSGIGKSALVGHFLETVCRERGLVFSGRCYAHEQVPYKAFDVIVDQLSRYLCTLPAIEVARLLPRDSAALTRMFPTLSRVAMLLRTPERRDWGDEAIARARAFGALKELLARIADSAALTICVDDLQWGDFDSARLLCELVAAPDAPAALFACTYRSEERDTSPMLRALFADREFAAACCQLELSPLSPSEAHRLVTLADPSAAAHSERIVEEANGSPFFLGELVRHLSTHQSVASVSDVVLARVARLGVEARSLLEVVCAAGRPVPQTAALRAAGLLHTAPVRELSLACLVRTRTLPSGTTLEAYHDRVRESVGASLSAERARQLNLALAHAYERAELADPEALVQFYLRAGEQAEAARLARAAADQAVRAFAYERAAQLLQIAAEYSGSEQEPTLTVALANAYELAGRPVEAAEAFERASVALPDQRVALSSRAMRLYIQAGYLARGRALLRQLCRELDIYYPASRVVATTISLLAYVMQRARRRIDTWLLQRTALVPRQRQRLQARFDLLWSAGVGLYPHGRSEPLWFVVRALSTGRKLASPESLPLAMMLDDLVAVTLRRLRDVRTQEQRVERALAVARSTERPELLPVVHAYAANVWGMHGEVGRCVEALDEADRLLQERGLAPGPLIPFMRTGQVIADHASGRLARALRLVPAWIREAKERRDVFHEAMLGVVGAHYHLILDAPDDARAMIEQSYARAQSFVHPLAGGYQWRAWVELYCGRPERVMDFARRAHGMTNLALQRGLAGRRLASLLIQGHAATAAYLLEPRAELLRRLEHYIRSLARERFRAAVAARLHLSACLANLRGERERECADLAAARDAYAACGIHLYAQACNQRLGCVLGGEHGRTLVASARADLLAQGVVNPERWFAMLSPGRYGAG